MTALPSLRVLIAEDDFLVAESVRSAVEELGHVTAGIATSGSEAVAMTRLVGPDVVLMDVRMPGLDGLEAAERIRDEATCPVIVLTAHESPPLIERATRAGVSSYLLKPVRAHELERAIRLAVAHHVDVVQLRDRVGSLRNRISQLGDRRRRLDEAQSTLARLRGLHPICSGCKRIRDEHQIWHAVEVYFRDRFGAQFTHGLCPTCVHELYDDPR